MDAPLPIFVLVYTLTFSSLAFLTVSSADLSSITSISETDFDFFTS
jgi:hypothetical protein